MLRTIFYTVIRGMNWNKYFCSYRNHYLILILAIFKNLDNLSRPRLNDNNHTIKED